MHRIGRTGRCGKTGVATTFINKNSPETVLLDLKHLLIEAKQQIPLVLQSLEDHEDGIQSHDYYYCYIMMNEMNYDYDVAAEEDDESGTKGCIFCGGLGHRVANCPKRDSQIRQARKDRDDKGFGGGGGDY